MEAFCRHEQVPKVRLGVGQAHLLKQCVKLSPLLWLHENSPYPHLLSPLTGLLVPTPKEFLAPHPHSSCPFHTFDSRDAHMRECSARGLVGVVINNMQICEHVYACNAAQRKVTQCNARNSGVL